ncbi:MAG: Macrolide export ATP-binding/permease protein MacB [Candidatus Nomurabacteria bacterium GW2011_GWE1_32_28]|uniref:Macrolide export ATP-binding/permease protein MacB n=1 Tax=Candidatus Nomurabacteria bacterium GW2011_GWF1_31_48 TaxID=1618767 RepID=A0A0F9YEQ6_9BACT|nr:MAG: Macrolide export ATP-binding/permease protein MacB [Candidatus Nomurabacteria bacterium GW2011_GWF2_30_133]KKP28549.1 MAG: Macrolide export ATP-binding/permease protein MacB [Candidatus Nomurabacteria bacterium GW2011_GWE2_31_40]KKP30144.1 MAG: Macrolide export ATP-binding/permease protein MacB [Candidatus Nomurabacteria bacterium GW2011_GWF1_31_48]KKP34689.1 MAG: Macrolide export ATP-binding/permease protein MacB [Candidatus Nomurabacteria bacterium GW2011_GWE1_32_28]
MSEIIRTENLNLWYDKGKPTEVHSLKDVNINIEKGDYVSFFGPSGCGKTSILYAISGIDRFQEGKVFINNRDISGLTNQELAIFRQTGIGIVFQQFNLVPSLTVLKNVALPMLFVGISSEKADAEARKLIERLDILQYADHYPFELSGGQQQRVGIARALANDPPIIIADEPLGNLDSVNAKKVLNFLKELNEKDGRTVIMVTHEAWSLRDVKTIFHMKDGLVNDVQKVDNSTSADSISKHLNEQLSFMSSSNNKKEEHIEERISARVLANFLLRGYSMDEIMRFESFVNQRFENKINKKEFSKFVNMPFKDGGVGLWKKKTERVTQYLEEILEEKKNIEHIYKVLEENPEMSIFDEILSIRNWVLEGYTGKITPVQASALDQIISDRIRNFISADKVVELLDLSKNKFGVGLSFRASQVISEKLELLFNEDNLEINSENSEKKL